ncbi:restriction endonuclease subunit S [Methylomonas sp. DH-1]|uniref:restriction endonuclease subunit S n=1 Tax=Methylomonas sp. (strain DH-1) TaxID=1727196 RepID=UPI0007C8C4E6|nr:restriction endonuclease subunit S [Methylomonas sp. DH-1]ANE56905.1 hypothetical protein AYM39_18140 [Methylomonas sp. DH-1]
MEHSLVLEELPKGWEIKFFCDICNKISESYQPTTDGDSVYLGLEHLEKGFPRLIGKGSENEVKSSKSAFKNGDVLFGKLRPYLRKSVLVDFEGVCSTDILVFRNKENAVNEYLKYLVHTDQFIQHAIKTTAGVQHPRTSWASLKTFKLSLPPKDEQRKIALVLSTIQQAIELQENLINTTQELKKALMQKLFTEGLRGGPQKETEIGFVPESWSVAPIENVAEIKASAMSYTQLANENNQDNSDLIIHGVKVSDMNIEGNEIFFNNSNLVRFLDEAKIKRTVPSYSIIFPKRGAAIATNKKRIAREHTVLDPNLIALIPKNIINYKYLYWWIETFDLRMITEPGPTPQLNKKNIAPILMPLPCLSEQIEISGAIDSVQNKVEISQAKKKLLTELFNTMLHKLMTAEIRVNELDLTELEQTLAN